MALDARDLKIALESQVRYVDTGTIGKVLDIKTTDDVDWVKLDKTGLWYKAALVEVLDDKDVKKGWADNSKDIDIDELKDKAMNFEEMELAADSCNGGG